MAFFIFEVDLLPGQPEGDLAAQASRLLRTSASVERILKKSIDARKRGQVVVRYRAVFRVPDADRARLKTRGEPWVPETSETPGPSETQPRVVIVGSGPAGLFCALRLLERGIRSTVLEQGKPVDQRHLDVEKLKAEGVLDPDSNVVFGEGGAGTYSDGKLTTRIHKPGISWVFDCLVDHGAPGSILYDAKPHIGTDVLGPVVVSIRQRLEAGGTRVLFGQKVVDLRSRAGVIVGVQTATGEEFGADAVVLACGHSARGLYEILATQGLPLERKGFAVGVRIEHPAAFINQAQYGSWADQLPAADYRLAWNNPVTGRGTYSFCMCPGGEVINASSEQGLLCVNGMSESRRDSRWSNAALVTTVGIDDGPPGILGGMEFQREIEARGFQAGGGGQGTPVSSARAFVDRRPGVVPGVSYRPRGLEADFDALLPAFVATELRQALADFDRKIPGFIDEGALIGVETRTSSPVRILRGADFQSPGLRGLYPAGEGAGYAGGIVSSAVDGVRVADVLCTRAPM